MAYNDKQEAWLTKTVTAVAASKDAGEMAVKRDEGRKVIAEQLESQKLVIQQTLMGTEIDMKVEGFRAILREKVGLSNKMALLDPGHDPMAEVDSWHDLPQAKDIPPNVVRAIVTEVSKILIVQAELLKNDYYKEPELSDPPTAEELDAQKEARRRLAEDLWKPLEREGIIPENFVPDEYSEVNRTFMEANALYEERLQEYTAELGEHGEFMRKFEDGMAVGQGLIKLATAGADLTAAAGALAKSSDVVKDAKEAKEILGWVELGMSSSSAMVKGALKERDAISVIDGLNMYVSKLLSEVLDEDLAKAINTSVEVALRSCSAGKKFAQGDYKGGMLEVATAVFTGFSGVDKTEEDEGLKTSGKDIHDGIAKLANDPKIAELLKSGDTNKAMGEIFKQLPGIVGSAKGALEQLNESLSEDTKEARAAQAKIKEKFSDEALAAQAEEAARIQREDFEEFMRREDRAFGEMMAYGFADPDGDDEEIEQAELKRLESLEHLIAVQVRNQKMFDLSRKISKGGIDLVSKLVPGMSLVAAAQQLAYSIAEAIKHTQQLLIWMDNVSDAGKAQTVQMDAMMNRYGLQKKQALQANLTVAIDAVRVCGEAMKLAGQAAPVGLVVSASADTAAAALEVAAKIVEIAEMESAWRDYKKALSNPKDRKNIRKTLRTNPTLSKYAMAYGAIDDGNPIAQEAMRRCGLNERTLAQKDAKVSDVVTYLETIYRDDPVLLRSVPPRDAWHPSGDPELTFRSWIAYFNAAVANAEPKLKQMDVSKINVLLGELVKLEEAMQAAIVEAQEANKALEPADFADSPVAPDAAVLSAPAITAEKLRVGFSKLSVMGVDGNRHVEMASYVDAMSAKAKLKMDECKKIETAQPWLMI